MLKIGLGYDFHTLKEGRPLMLGGVHIPCEKGEMAHSDGDAWQKVLKEGWKLENIDSIIIIEKPKLKLYREKIIASIANILNVEEEKIFVKFKTHEKMGDIGQGKAVSSMATALISK